MQTLTLLCADTVFICFYLEMEDLTMWCTTRLISIYNHLVFFLKFTFLFSLMNNSASYIHKEYFSGKGRGVQTPQQPLCPSEPSGSPSSSRPPKPRRRPRPKEPEEPRRSRSAPAQSILSTPQPPTHTVQHEGFLYRKHEEEGKERSPNRCVSY